MVGQNGINERILCPTTDADVSRDYRIILYQALLIDGATEHHREFGKFLHFNWRS